MHVHHNISVIFITLSQSLQAWAQMEAVSGAAAAARALFQEALDCSPCMPHVYTTWAAAESAHGNIAQARQLFKQGAAAVPGHAPLLHVSK